ncbi:MAG: histidinol-phosphate transaminase [Trueperaceae bacterium]
MSIRARIRELAPYDFAPHAEGVKLDQNELPEDIPESLREELVERVGSVALNRYPDLTASELRTRLAELHGWPVDGVIVTPGSNVLIQCLVIAAGIEQRVIVPSPSFGVYRLQARMLGAELNEVPMSAGFGLPVRSMLREMERGRGVVFIANPAAPTGNLHPRSELEALIAAADDRWTIVIDEAYHQFAGSDFLELAQNPSVVSLRTLSKAFGLAGARVGYALTSPELAEELRKTVNPFAVSVLQQAAALTMLDHQDLVLARAREVAVERDWLFDRLLELPDVSPFPSVANFILLRLTDGPRAHRELLRRGVIVRRQDGGMLTNCLRVSVGTRAENRRFLDELRQVVAEVGNG